MTAEQIRAVEALKKGEIIKGVNKRGHKYIMERVLGKYNVIMNAKGVIEEQNFDHPEPAIVFAGIQ